MLVRRKRLIEAPSSGRAGSTRLTSFWPCRPAPGRPRGGVRVSRRAPHAALQRGRRRGRSLSQRCSRCLSRCSEPHALDIAPLSHAAVRAAGTPARCAPAVAHGSFARQRWCQVPITPDAAPEPASAGGLTNRRRAQGRADSVPHALRGRRPEAGPLRLHRAGTHRGSTPAGCAQGTDNCVAL